MRALAVTLICSAFAVTHANAQGCEREAFTGLVDQAKAELTALNTTNKQLFQAKLQVLKDSRGWSDKELVANATPFVRDETIAAFDDETKALLARIPELNVRPSRSVASLAGAVPSANAALEKRCAAIERLQGILGKVVESTRAKWAYMIGKLDVAIAAEGGNVGAAQ